MAGKGGGAWKVAYADFVTAMMAFFMVMWLTSQNEEVKEAIAHHFEDPFSINDPNDFASEPGKSHPLARNAALAKKPDKLNKKERRTHKPTIVTLGAGKQTSTGTIIFFSGHSTDLEADATSRLDALVPAIRGKPQRIEIRGHASRRPLPADCPFRDAWQISYARCEATMRYLEVLGIPAERMRLSQGGVYEPYAADGPDKLDQQERVEVQLLNEVLSESLPEEQTAPPPQETGDRKQEAASGTHHAEPSGSHGPPAAAAPESTQAHADQHPAAESGHASH